MSEKFAKFKAAAKSNFGQEQAQFEHVLNEVNRGSMLPILSTLTQTQNDVYYDMKCVLDELKSDSSDSDTCLFDSEFQSDLLYLISRRNDDDEHHAEFIATQKRVAGWLSNQCQLLKDKTLSVLPSPQTLKKGEKGTGLKDFFELLGKYEHMDTDASLSPQSSDKQMLHHYFDADAPMHYMAFVEKFITFIKNTTRFMLQTVPGLLITSELTVSSEKEKEDLEV